MNSASLSPTVKHVVFDLLRGFGIDTVFGNPGSTERCFSWDPGPTTFVMPSACRNLPPFQWPTDTQATGNAAFVNLHSAVRLAHALGNIYTAFRNQTPTVITAGQRRCANCCRCHPHLVCRTGLGVSFAVRQMEL